MDKAGETVNKLLGVDFGLGLFRAPAKERDLRYLFMRMFV